MASTVSLDSEAMLGEARRNITNVSTEDSIGDKLGREAQLLMGAPQYIVDGISKRFEEMKNNPAEAGVMMAQGVAIGLGVALLTRNPTALFGAGKFMAAHPRAIAAAGIGLDATMRAAPAMVDTWNNPENLERNKMLLGNNLGAAAIDYPLFAAGGYAGAALPETASSAVNGLRSMSFRIGNQPLFAPQMRLAMAEAGATGRGISFAAMPEDVSTMQMSVRNATGGRIRPASEIVRQKDPGGGKVKALEESEWADAEGRFLGRGDETIAVDLGDGSVLKVSEPARGWREFFGEREFDAALLAEPDVHVDGRHVVYVQEKLKPLKSDDVRFERFVRKFDPDGEYGKQGWHFPDVRDNQVGLDASGKVKVADYDAIRSTGEGHGKNLAGDQQAIGGEMRNLSLNPEQQGPFGLNRHGKVEKTTALNIVMQASANPELNGMYVSRGGWNAVKDDPTIIALVRRYNRKAVKSALESEWG